MVVDVDCFIWIAVSFFWKSNSTNNVMWDANVLYFAEVQPPALALQTGRLMTPRFATRSLGARTTLTQQWS